jgi:dimethylaniline monooxygenase (N-oxide forming)
LPGLQVHDYLKAYAKKFGIDERLRLSTRVSKVSRSGDNKGWVVEIEQSDEKFECDKLILATGLNSQPNWPDIPINEFRGLAIHSKDVGLHHTALTSEKVNRVSVYGGGKSAIDTINLCILAGKKVDWIIRDTGNGIGMMLQTRRRGVHGARFLARWNQVVLPSIFIVGSFWYRFLHSGKNRLGTWICDTVWRNASKVPFTQDPYTTKSSNMEKLMPETRE